MEEINRFIKGVKNFRDKTLIQGDEWVFPTTGVRATNYDEKALAITFVRGNTYKSKATGYEFELSDGFVAIGSVEYNGILYIVSAKEDDSGEAEIGSFPSPYWAANIPGLHRIYRPLRNFQHPGGVGYLRTKLFNYTTKHEVDIIAKEMYDGTVNLYLADFFNSNIVINTSFDQQGNYNGFVYKASNFEGSLNLIPTSFKFIKTSLEEVSVGGVLNLGMYYLYFRYVSKDYNTTRFLGSLSPIQVTYGTSPVDTVGGFEFDIKGKQNKTNKKIGIKFVHADFDKGYEFLEIAVARYYSDNNNTLQADIYIIDKMYPIIELDKTLWITGHESKRQYTLPELISKSNSFSISKSQAIVGSRYYGANWKSVEYDIDALIAYAQKITLEPCFEDIQDANEITEDASLLTVRPQYQEEDVTLKKVGHFRGELYPYAVKYIMIDGSETQAYPVTGAFFYNYGNAASQTTNNKGIFTFPFYDSTYGANEQVVNDQSKAMGITFKMGAARQYYLDNIQKFSNVKGIVFVRGKRIKNLLYQGVTAKMAKNVLIEGGSTFTSFKNNRRIPWIDHAHREFPVLYMGGSISNGIYPTRVLEARGLGFDGNKMAMYSPDFFFNDSDTKTSSGAAIYIQTIFNKNIRKELSGGGANIVTRYAVELDSLKHADLNLGSVEDISIDYVQDGVFDGPGGFCSIVQNGFRDSGNSLAYSTANLSGSYVAGGTAGFIFGKYIGLSRSSGINIPELSVVNVYSFDNARVLYDTQVSAINLGTEEYYDLTSQIKFNTVADTNVFKGDCFLQRFYFRQSRIFDSVPCFKDYDSDTASPGHYYRAGLEVSVILETEVNVAARGEVEYVNGTKQWMHTFYPKVLSETSLLAYCMNPKLEKYKHEGRFINKGYNQIVGPTVTYGYNQNNNYIVDKRPTRIYFSQKSRAGEKKDGFRDIGILSYQDYPLENRQIVALASVNDELVSIQEDSIQKHKMGQRQLTPGSGSDITLKLTSLYLSDETIPLAAVGSQHKQSVISVGDSIYGVDFKRRLIWGIFGQLNEYTGRSNYQALPISESGEVVGWVKDIGDKFDRMVDRSHALGENPVNGEGINSGYNARYKEVNFTFQFRRLQNVAVDEDDIPLFTDVSPLQYVSFDIIKVPYKGAFTYYFRTPHTQLNPPAPSGNCNDNDPNWKCIDINKYKTFESKGSVYPGSLIYVCSGLDGRFYITPVRNPKSIEDLKYFRGTNSAVPGYKNNFKINCTYNVYNRTIVFDNLLKAFVGEMPYKPSHYFRLGENMFTSPNILDDKPRKQVFIHDNLDSDVGVFYGKKHDAKISIIVSGKETREIVKMFNAYAIETSDKEFKSIEFFTDYGQSKIEPFIPTDGNLVYIKPEYLEGMWRGPVKESDINNDNYFTESELRGTYLKITLTYDGNDETYIRKIITSFSKSSM